MDKYVLRGAVEELLAAYAQCLDADKLEEWPDFFTDPCLYQVIPRENDAQGLPIALIYCDSRGMLRDRVVAHRQANIYGPHAYRHLISNIRMNERADGAVTVHATYAVLRTLLDPVRYGSTEVYSAGEYRDVLVWVDGQLKVREKTVVVDTCRIDSLLVTPL
jgi:anthranilate 1,2-dioxygenase small subunit